MSESEKCRECYAYLKEMGIDCPADCDYPAAKKIMRSLMLKYHPDKNPGNEQESAAIFKKLADCNDRIIKNECMKSVESSPGFRESRRKAECGAQGLAFNPFTDECIAKEEFCEMFGLVYSPLTDTCIVESPSQKRARKQSRRSKSRSRRSASRSGKKTAAQKRAECKAQGLVYDTVTGECRASRRAWGESRAKRSASRSGKKTIAQKRAECKAQGLVYDTVTGECRASKRGGRGRSRSASRASSRSKSRRSASRASSRSKSRRSASRASSRSKSRRSASRRSGKKTIAQKRAECKAKGLVYDTITGKCRASKRGRKSRSL